MTLHSLHSDRISVFIHLMLQWMLCCCSQRKLCLSRMQSKEQCSGKRRLRPFRIDEFFLYDVNNTFFGHDNETVGRQKVVKKQKHVTLTYYSLVKKGRWSCTTATGVASYGARKSRRFSSSIESIYMSHEATSVNLGLVSVAIHQFWFFPNLFLRANAMFIGGLLYIFSF